MFWSSYTGENGERKENYFPWCPFVLPAGQSPQLNANPALVDQINFADWLVTQKDTKGSQFFIISKLCLFNQTKISKNQKPNLQEVFEINITPKRQSRITSLLVVRFYFKMAVRNLDKKLKK